MKTHPTSVACTEKMKRDEERKRECFLLPLKVEQQNPKTKTLIFVIKTLISLQAPIWQNVESKFQVFHHTKVVENFLFFPITKRTLKSEFCSKSYNQNTNSASIGKKC